RHTRCYRDWSSDVCSSDLDGIQQHDSRYQEGFNTQYLHPFRLWGNQSLLTAGTNFHENQINVGLYPQNRRVPLDVATRAFAGVKIGRASCREREGVSVGED